MNDTDFHNCMKNNREVYAREQARLEHIYEQEKAKYSSPLTTTTTHYSYYTNNNRCQSNDNTSTDIKNIKERLDKMESRIDKLYEMFGNNNKPKYSSDGMFIIAPDNANIMANQSITLTDEQFEKLLDKIMNN